MTDSYETTHISVLPREVIDGLRIEPTDTVVDATINGGGHAKAMADLLGSKGTLVGFDLDSSAIERSWKLLEHTAPQKILINENFRNLQHALGEKGFEHADKILFDLGWSTNQFSDPARGFSFALSGPLAMTLKDNPGPDDVTAYDVVNTWQEDTLEGIIRTYGEERYTGRIARAIVLARQKSPIQTTMDLVNIIEKSVPLGYLHGRIHPATRTFQAIRIAVNDELGALKEGLEQALEILNPGGRIAVISFHSLEDRIVKDIFKTAEDNDIGLRITKKPIIPSQKEIFENRRARSAKLRIFQKKL